MRIPVLLAAMAAAASISARASQPAAADGRSVAVCVEEGSDNRVRGIAEPLAATLFADIGVKIVWSRDERRCLGATEAIFIRMVYDSRPDEHPHAFGYAVPYGGRRIVVYYDRVQRLARHIWAPRLLAYVLAHEIAHVLQASDRHSEAGIMKAVWNDDDLYAMDRGTLHFTPMDVFLIDRGLDGP